MALLRYSPWLHLDYTKGAKLLKESSGSTSSSFIRRDATPRMALLIGRKAKSTMLRQILPDIHPDCFATPHGQAFMWHDTEDAGQILVDFELHNYDKGTPMVPTINEVIVTRNIDCTTLSEQSYTRRQFGNLFSGRALAPMCHTLCYFASDLGGLRGVATLLATQMLQPSASNLPTDCLPRVLIVIDTAARNFSPGAVVSSIMEAIAHLLKSLPHGNSSETGDITDDDVSSLVKRHFYEIQVIGLLRSASLIEKGLLLRERLSDLSQQNAVARNLHGLCFKRDHFFTMMDRLLDHFVVSWTQPFSFVKSSRPIGFTLEELLFHLQEVFSLLPAEVWMGHFLCPLLASTILLANYPPGSHRKTLSN